MLIEFRYKDIIVINLSDFFKLHKYNFEWILKIKNNNKN